MQFVLQGFEQVQDLRLHRHVERRSRLVADDQFRLHGQRPGNGNALALAAGEFVRVTLRGVGIKADLLQQGGNRCHLFVSTGDIERAHAFSDDFTNSHARVERGKRVLKNHLHAPTQRPQGAASEAGELPAIKLRRATCRPGQLQNTLAHGGFSATGFADQRQRPTARQLQRYPINSLDVAHRALKKAAPDREVHAEIGHREQCFFPVLLWRGLPSPVGGRGGGGEGKRRLIGRHCVC